MILLDGKSFAKKVRLKIKSEVAEFSQKTGVKPGLAAVLVGENPASKIYVGRKAKACDEVGIYSQKVELPQDISQFDLEEKIHKLNHDPQIHGILVQLPLPPQVDSKTILSHVQVEKDVDGFHVINAGRLATGQPATVPCTPLGILRLLEEYQIPLKGKRAVVIGRSNIVGKPMAHLLLGKHATVTICHSRTQDIKEICLQADLVVAATGKPQMVRGNWIKEGAAVVDVGINRLEDGKLVGDVAFEEVSTRAGWLTPVPGGVGPLTIAMLLSNTLDLARTNLQKKT